MSTQSLTPRGFVEAQAPPNDGDVWVYDAATDKSGPKAQAVQVLPITWSPADVTLDETDAAVLVLPAPSLVLGAYWQRATPTDAGSTPTLHITDDTGTFDSGTLALKSDSATVFKVAFSTFGFFDQSVNNVGWAGTGSGGLSLFATASFTFDYVAGLTPGATKPVFKLVCVYIPIA